LGEPTPELTLALSDATGRTAYETKVRFDAGELKRRFEWPQLPAGMYVLRVLHPDGAVRLPVVIQRH
jgi:hypothetical protein